MTKFKRLVAATLAFLMVLTSVSALAFAGTSSDGTGTKLTIATKIFRQIGDSWVETEKVIPGETVKARVYVGTNYYTNDGQLLFFYNTDFFEDASVDGISDLKVNPEHSIKTLNGTYISSESVVPIISKLKANGVIDDIANINSNLSADSLAFFSINYKFSDGSKVVTDKLLNVDEWLCEFELKVKSDADITATTGNFFALPASARSPKYQRGYINVPKGSYEGLPSDVESMALWQADLNMPAENMAEVTLYTDYVEATFNAGTDATFKGGATQKLYTGSAGEPLEPEVPEKAGYNFLGWVVSGVQGSSPITITAFPSVTTTYEAAWEEKTVEEYTLGFRTEIWRETSPGVYEYTDKVIPGEDVKLRVFVDTDYYTSAATLLIFYENDFFTDAYTDGAVVSLTLNDKGSAVTEGVRNAKLTAIAADDYVFTGDVNMPAQVPDYVSQEYVDTHNAFVVNFDFKDGKSHILSDEEWLFEIDLQVLEEARGCGKAEILESTIASTSRQLAFIDVPVSEDASTPNGAGIPLYALDLNYDIVNKKACTWTSVSFDADGGTFAETTEAIYTIDGHITDPIPADKLPQDPTKATYTFAGWVPEGKEMTEENALTIDELIAQYPEFTFDELLFTALWTKNVTITFADTGDTVIDPIEDVTPGDEFAEIADPVKDGYTFRGWDIEEGVLPEVYPEVDTTYTAIWAKNVVVSFETESGTDVPAVEGYEGQDFPVDEIPEPEKEGHYFVGWSTNGKSDGIVDPLPGKFPGEDKIYYAIYEPKTYQVNYWILDPVSMKFDKFTTVPTIFGETIIPTPPKYEVPEGYELSAAYTDISFETPLANEAKMPANTVDLYFKLTVQKFDVTFDPDGGTWADGTTESIVRKDQVYDTEIVEPFAPTKDGHKFLGWDKPVTNVPAEDVTFTAVWETLMFDATYIIEGEEIIEGKESETFDEILYGDPVEVPADPEVVGKTFVKWVETTDNKEPTEYVDGMPSRNLTFKAVFENKVYDLTYDLDGGNIDGNEDDVVYEDVPYESEVPVPEKAPDKEGYKFAGWDADPSTPEIDEVPKTMPADELTVVARWEKRSFKVTYTLEGGNIDGNVDDVVYNEVLFGDVIPVPEKAPEKEGHEFDKWVDENGNTLASYTDGMPAKELTFKATYIVNNYKVTIDPDGGTWDDGTTDPIEKENLPYGSDIEMPEAPEKEGYEFAGWDNPATETPTDAPSTVPAGDTTIVATWDKLSYKATYISEGEIKAEYNIPYGDAVTVPEEKPVKTGYEFVKWVEETDKKEPAEYVDGMPAKALTFKAEFKVNVHDLTFKLNGGNINGDENDVVKPDIPYASPIIAPPQPVKDGYNFLGWSSDGGKTILSADELGTMPDSDIEFTAYWEANPDREYVIEFYKQDPNTGEYPSDPYQVDTLNNGVSDKEVTYNVTVVPEGFELDEDNSELSGIVPANPDEKLVLKVYFMRKQYDFDAYVDGEQKVDETYKFEQNVKKVTEPTKPGYTFAGWVDNATPDDQLATAERFEIPQKMPANNIAIKATWNINTYDAVFDANGGAFPEDAPVDYAGDETVTFPVDYETDIPAPVVPEKDGFDFIGWDDTSTPEVENITDPGNIGDGDKEYVAVWEKSTSALKFYDYIDSEKGPAADGSDVYYPLDGEGGDVKYGEAIEFPETLPEAQWKQYYDFKGWADKDGNMVATVDEDGNLVTTATMPGEDYNLYAVYERHVVKLVPINEESTAVIEREGVTESYMADFGAVHYEYPYKDTTGYEEWFVYGVPSQTTEATLREKYVAVYGDGHFEVNHTKISRGFFCGTGAEIIVYDDVTGEVVEKLFIVIFGDLNGDARINSVDSGLSNEQVQKGQTWLDKDHADYRAFLYKAANIDSSDGFNSDDNNFIGWHAAREYGFTIDPTYGVPRA